MAFAGGFMKLDFVFQGTRYMLNFEDPLCEKDVVELRVYNSLDSNGTYSSSLKRIQDNKLVWRMWDDGYLSKEARDYCDRIIKMKAFL